MRRGIARLGNFGASSLFSGRRAVASAAPAVASSVSSSQAFPPYLLNTPPTEVSTLSNGLRVASEYKPGETATVGIWIDAGSVWENAQNNGVAHFLEHMAFKGTNKRTREQIEIEVENMGGQLNAYTSREQTVYHAHVFKNDVPKAVEIIADILQNSKLSEEDIERERGVILREMEEVESQTEEVIFDHLHSVAFQGTPLGYTILGPEQNIKKIQRQDLLNYVNTHYTGPRMVLAGAGNINHADLVKLAEKNFGNLSAENKADFKNGQKFDFTGSQVQVHDSDVPLSHVAIGVRGVSWTDPNYFTFLVIQNMIGSWDRSLGGGKNLSSKLCELYATEGLVHSMMSFNTCYNDLGMFGAYLVAEPEQTADAICELLKEWVRIGFSSTEAEVERAKNKVKAVCLMQLDGTYNAAEDIGRQVLTLGRRMSPAEVFLRINEVDLAQVREVAYNYLNDTDPAVAVFGAAEGVHFPDYNTIRGWTYWNRL